MKRIYKNSSENEVIFFIGNEVENTPAYGLKTLFVVGVQHIDDILAIVNANNIEHIFFGANHSFNPNEYDDWEAWETLITHFLKLGYLCSLDIPMSAVPEFNEGELNSYDNFIPQIRVPIPYLKQWNYNTTIKIDDSGFQKTNPGVWSHQLSDLTTRDRFTSWREYANDTIIGNKTLD